MRYRTLGRTGLEVSEVGFGAWGIGKVMWKGADDTESLMALNVAIDQGLNFIDTALAYGNGHSEKLVCKVVQNRSERVYVATKVPPQNMRWPAQGRLRDVFPRQHILRCAERSLRNLGTEVIDLLQLHVWAPKWLQSDEWYDALCQLREEGKVAFFGVSINDHEPDSAIELVESGKIDTVQVIFNIFDQSPMDRLLPACKANEVGVIARVPFDEGGLTGRITPQTTFPKGDWRNLYFKNDRKQQVSDRISKLQSLLGHEASTLSELALRFCLMPDTVKTVIPGMRTVGHVVSNCAVSDKPPLSEPLIKELKRHRWIRNFYPAG